MNDAADMLHESGRRHVARIVAAAAIVVALHVGGAALALVTFNSQEQSMEDVGAPMVVEFEAMPVAPETEQAEATPAEDAQAAAAAPEVTEKLSAKREDDLPTTQASPFEVPPDLQLAQQTTQKQQSEAEDGQPTEAMDAREQEAAPSQAAAASVAAAPMTTALDERAAAPAEGSVSEAQVLPPGWQRAIMAHLGRHKRYPLEARQRHVEGEVLLRFTMDRTGRIRSASLSRPSGAPILDVEALAMLVRAQPLPALPTQVRGDQVELVVPINYRLK
jgi:protein TonB